MFGGSFSVENRIGLKFRCFGSIGSDEKRQYTVEKLPFEMFFHASSGELTMVDGENAVVCHAGETLFLPADTGCELAVGEACEFSYIGIDLRIFESLRVFSLYALPTLLTNSRAGELCRLICKTARDNEFTNSRMENAVTLDAALFSLTSVMLSLGAPISDGSVIDLYKRLSPVLTHIGACMGLPMEMEELSALLGLDEGAFYRFFRSVTGEAPRDYLLSERFRHARLMLLETDDTVKDISKQCGYESPFSFSTLFRGRFGVSPSDYRKGMRSFLV